MLLTIQLALALAIFLFNLKLLIDISQSRRPREVDGSYFNIFGLVHAMKTEIPPFDSEIKDILIRNDTVAIVIINIVEIYGHLNVKQDHILSNYVIV
jgi:hypothetical protein